MDAGLFFVGKLGNVVIAAGKVGVLGSNGFSTVTAAGLQLVYSPSTLELSASCLSEVSIGPAGPLAFLPRCTGKPMRGGTADGATLTTLYQPRTGNARTEESFSCHAADPSGGFYVLVTGSTGASPRLYHLPAGQSGTLDLVPTEPSFGEVSVARGGGGAALFRDCAMTVAPDGAVYVVTQKELWKAAP